MNRRRHFFVWSTRRRFPRLCLLTFVCNGKINKSSSSFFSSSLDDSFTNRHRSVQHMCRVSFRIQSFARTSQREERERNETIVLLEIFFFLRSLDSHRFDRFHFISALRSSYLIVIRSLSRRRDIRRRRRRRTRRRRRRRSRGEERREGKFLTFADFGIHLLNLPDQQWPFYFLSSSSLFLFFSLLLFDPKGNERGEREELTYRLDFIAHSTRSKTSFPFRSSAFVRHGNSLHLSRVSLQLRQSTGFRATSRRSVEPQKIPSTRSIFSSVHEKNGNQSPMKTPKALASKAVRSSPVFAKSQPVLNLVNRSEMNFFGR